MTADWRTELRNDLPGLVRACRENFAAIVCSPAFLSMLALVALVEGVLFGLALATVYGDVQGIDFPVWFYLDEEFSFGEIWEYCLTTAAATGLFWRYLRFREPIVGCLALVFVWLTIDNALALHEAIGHTLSPLFAFAEHSTPNPDDYGELVTFGSIGFVILLGLLFNGLRSDRDSVIQSLAIISMLALAALFGVLFDFVDHALAGNSPLLRGLLSVIEDGSELVGLGIAAVIAMTARPPVGLARAR